MNPWRKCFSAGGRPPGLSVALIIVSLTLLQACQRDAPAAGTWSETGPSTPREGHTATLLTDGRVLVAGGVNYITVLSSAELFHPAAGTWSKTGPMFTGRFDHTATRLADGRVLAAGGAQWAGSNIALASAELFNPATGTYSPAGPLATARYGHTATLLADGRVLVAGGYSSALSTLASAELFDPAKKIWIATGSMYISLTRHTATRLADGRVLVTGGSSGGTSAGAQFFDPATGIWNAANLLATARYGHTATLLADGRVLVVGGAQWVGGKENYLASAELFNPATLTWSAAGSLATARVGHTATLLADGRVLVAGGDATSGYSYHRAELYDPLNLVANGSFETASADPGAGLIKLPASSSNIAHWTVWGAGIDYKGGYWQPAEGRRSLDLNALDSGAVMAEIKTSPGASYLVTFALAGNPDGGPTVKSLRVILGGKAQDFSFDTTGKSRTDMGWTTKSCTLAGAGGTQPLLFQSLTSGPYGPALDNVRVIFLTR
jgi:choice-of-anchor C domain-containing protein